MDLVVIGKGFYVVSFIWGKNVTAGTNYSKRTAQFAKYKWLSKICKTDIF